MKEGAGAGRALLGGGRVAGRPAGWLARSLARSPPGRPARRRRGRWVRGRRERAQSPQPGSVPWPSPSHRAVPPSPPSAGWREALRRRCAERDGGGGGGKQRSPPLPGAPAWLGADPRVPGARSPGARLAPARSAFPLRVGPCWVRRRVCVWG